MKSIKLHNSDFTKGQHDFLSHQIKRNKIIYHKLQGEGISKFTHEQHCLPNLMSFSWKGHLHHGTSVGKFKAQCSPKANWTYWIVGMCI